MCPGRPEWQRRSAVAGDSVMLGAAPTEDAGRRSSPGGRRNQESVPSRGAASYWAQPPRRTPGEVVLPAADVTKRQRPCAGLRQNGTRSPRVLPGMVVPGTCCRGESPIG
ncbi:hypothetical protein NDU88_004687 [Pleurodeles waltl]|uniref:Uncharacterized protein n=1 Tax=Pleurodeles waltl TaxID=8319 RepID=A0AAV7W870_PLEWA|nr:hypothetical protein NDU88_004687 [Pleurodeles waltl]